MSKSILTRRNVLQTGAAAGAGLGTADNFDRRKPQRLHQCANWQHSHLGLQRSSDRRLC